MPICVLNEDKVQSLCLNADCTSAYSLVLVNYWTRYLDRVYLYVDISLAGTENLRLTKIVGLILTSILAIFIRVNNG